MGNSAHKKHQFCWNLAGRIPIDFPPHIIAVYLYTWYAKKKDHQHALFGRLHLLSIVTIKCCVYSHTATRNIYTLNQFNCVVVSLDNNSFNIITQGRFLCLWMPASWKKKHFQWQQNTFAVQLCITWMQTYPRLEFLQCDFEKMEECFQTKIFCIDISFKCNKLWKLVFYSLDWNRWVRVTENFERPQIFKNLAHEDHLYHIAYH